MQSGLGWSSKEVRNGWDQPKLGPIGILCILERTRICGSADLPESHQGSWPWVRFPSHRAWDKDILVEVISKVCVSGREAMMKWRGQGSGCGGLVALPRTLPWSDPVGRSGIRAARTVGPSLGQGDRLLTHGVGLSVCGLPGVGETTHVQPRVVFWRRGRKAAGRELSPPAQQLRDGCTGRLRDLRGTPLAPTSVTEETMPSARSLFSRLSRFLFPPR